MDNRIDAIYGRQSIDKKDSISIESQFEFCRYELKGGEAKEYKDKGYSGKNIERPDFQRLLQDIRLGLIKRVIVYKLDRISRSIVDFAKLMELFKQYDVEFVSCTEKFDTSTPMGRAMLNICIVFAQLERESIQMRVQDAFYSRCTKGYYMRGRTPYGFDTEPIVMDGIKTKKLVENAEMDFAELMFQMYAEPGNSYGDITRYFVKHSIKVYDKALQRGFISKLLRNPVYVQADMDIYEYYKAQGVKIESPPEMFTGDNSCYDDFLNANGDNLVDKKDDALTYGDYFLYGYSCEIKYYFDLHNILREIRVYSPYIEGEVEFAGTDIEKIGQEIKSKLDVEPEISSYKKTPYTFEKDGIMYKLATYASPSNDEESNIQIRLIIKAK